MGPKIICKSVANERALPLPLWHRRWFLRDSGWRTATGRDWVKPPARQSKRHSDVANGVPYFCVIFLPIYNKLFSGLDRNVPPLSGHKKSLTLRRVNGDQPYLKHRSPGRWLRALPAARLRFALSHRQWNKYPARRLPGRWLRALPATRQAIDSETDAVFCVGGLRPCPDRLGPFYALISCPAAASRLAARPLFGCGGAPFIVPPRGVAACPLLCARLLSGAAPFAPLASGIGGRCVSLLGHSKKDGPFIRKRSLSPPYTICEVCKAGGGVCGDGCLIEP